MAKNTRKPSGKGGSAVATAGDEGGESTAPATPKVGPFKFIQQVRQEVSKITWPTRNETTVTTIMVFIMVTFASLFFLLVDEVLGRLVRFVLGFAG